MEQARYLYFKSLGLMTDHRVPFVLAEATVTVAWPGRLGMKCEVAARTAALGNTSFTMDYEIRGTTPCWSTATAVLVFVDDSLKPSPIPADWRATLAQFEELLVAAGTGRAPANAVAGLRRRSPAGPRPPRAVRGVRARRLRPGLGRRRGRARTRRRRAARRTGPAGRRRSAASVLPSARHGSGRTACAAQRSSARNGHGTPTSSDQGIAAVAAAAARMRAESARGLRRRPPRATGLRRR
jgi:acyl-CoA thioesterase FadM